MLELIELVYQLRAMILDALGCMVEEDLSSLCHGIVFGVPW